MLEAGINMTSLELENHLIAVVLNRHNGNQTAAAAEIDIGYTTVRTRLKSPHFHDLPENPMADAMLLVDILREYLPMLPPDQRLVVFEQLTDGYCVRCGSDACDGACPCEAGPCCNA